MASLPLLAFQHHVGRLMVNPDDLEYLCDLGQGALSLVEKACMTVDGKVVQVVIKSYKSDVIATPEDFRELLMEAGTLARLVHPHVPRFFGLGCYEHGSLAAVRASVFSVEEFVGTRSLRRLLAEQMRSPRHLYHMRWALRWAGQLAGALAMLHSHSPPYIHGDVTADNVLLEDHRHLEEAAVKLGDLKPHRNMYDRVTSLVGIVAAAHQQQHLPQQQQPHHHYPLLQQPPLPPPPQQQQQQQLEQCSLSRYSLRHFSSPAASGAAAAAPSLHGAERKAAALDARQAAGDGGRLGGHDHPQQLQHPPLVDGLLPPLHRIRSDPVAINGCTPPAHRHSSAGALCRGAWDPTPPGAAPHGAGGGGGGSAACLELLGSTPLERYLLTGVDEGCEKGIHRIGSGGEMGRSGAGGMTPLEQFLLTGEDSCGERGARCRARQGGRPGAAAGRLAASRSLPAGVGRAGALRALLSSDGDDDHWGGGRRHGGLWAGGRGGADAGSYAAPKPPPGALAAAFRPGPGQQEDQLWPHGAAAAAAPTPPAGTPETNGLCWDLSPSGAANPSGAAPSSLLDLFADVRPWDLDGPPVLLGGLTSALCRPPASFGAPAAVTMHDADTELSLSHLASPFSAAAVAAAVAPCEPPFAGGGNGGGGGCALARGGSGGSGGMIASSGGSGGVVAAVAALAAPADLFESKTHGSSTAFQALTAIDAIFEEECEEDSSHGSSRGGPGARRGAAQRGRGRGGGGGGSPGSPCAAAVEGAGGCGDDGASDASSGDDGSQSCSRRARLSLSGKAADDGTTSRDRGLLYAAPEALRGERLTEKADVFSFGVVLYELLSRSLLLGWRLPGTLPPPTPHAAAPDQSRSGRWAASAAAQLQQRGAGAEAAQMLAYAQRVADGYRAPAPPFWPRAVAELVAACCEQEPHERPRMAEVGEALELLSKDEDVISQLNSYVHKDIGFVPLWMEGGVEDADRRAPEAPPSAGAAASAGSCAAAAADPSRAFRSPIKHKVAAAQWPGSFRQHEGAGAGGHGAFRGGTDAKAAAGAGGQGADVAHNTCGCIVS